MRPAPAPHLVRRMQGFGTTVFTEMTLLSIAHDAINLGQGFPDDDPPAEVITAAQHALAGGLNQYAPGPGLPRLRRAISAHQQRFHGLDYDPDTEVSVTFGATEAVAATMLALCETGDEVLVIEPAYDAYEAAIALAGARSRRVPLTPPSFDTPGEVTGSWHLDIDRFAASINARTRLVLLNTPHNPTGTVLDTATLDRIAELCVANDLIAVTDEVYEHLVFEGRHVPLATRPGMRERTIGISSAGKTFSCTGWKIGWACAPPALTAAVRTVKQFLSFAGGTPLQAAVSVALGLDDDVYRSVADRHRGRRDLLVEGLVELGVAVTRAPGGYFVIADLRALGIASGERFCREAPAALGFGAVPVTAFLEPSNIAPALEPLVRLAFCKREDVLEQGLERLAGAEAAFASSR